MRFPAPWIQLGQFPDMPYDLFGVVVARKSRLFEHLAKDEVPILWRFVRKKSETVEWS